MAAIECFEDTRLQALCDVLGDTAEGLTGGEIGHILQSVGIDDPLVGGTKRHRLFAALQGRQRQDCCANNILSFVQAAMDPVRFVREPQKFHERRDRLNQALIFAGWSLGENGKLSRTAPASTMSDAQARAGRLRAALERRGVVHPDVMRFCKAELVANNSFHAVLEATKSLAEKVRNRTGLIADGAALVDEAFGFRGAVPYLALNSLQTETEQSEQSGFMNLLKGIFGHFRNPTAHAPRATWVVPEDDAVDLLTFTSYLHRRLDGAVRTHRGQP